MNDARPPHPQTDPSAAFGQPSKEQRQWGFFAHLSAFAGLVIPFGNLLGPFIVWQIKKDTMPFVEDQAKEALNFQITVSLALIASAVLMILLVGFLLMPIILIGAAVLTILGAVRANNGETYRYPLALRLIP